MAADGSTDQIDGDLIDALAELIGILVGRAEGIAHQLGVPGVFLKALHRLDCPMAMKDLGQRMHGEILANLPWRQALDPGERAQLLSLVRKILAAPAAGPAGPAGPVSDREEVSGALVGAPVIGVDG